MLSISHGAADLTKSNLQAHMKAEPPAGRMDQMPVTTDAATGSTSGAAANPSSGNGSKKRDRATACMSGPSRTLSTSTDGEVGTHPSCLPLPGAIHSFTRLAC